MLTLSGNMFILIGFPEDNTCNGEFRAIRQPIGRNAGSLSQDCVSDFPLQMLTVSTLGKSFGVARLGRDNMDLPNSACPLLW